MHWILLSGVDGDFMNGILIERGLLLNLLILL